MVNNRLVRIFIGESDRWKHRSLSRELIERSTGGGVRRCTYSWDVGIRRQQRHSHDESRRALLDLPVPIEVVDDDVHIERLLLILDQMLNVGALVTVERVRVLKYAAVLKRDSKKQGEP